MLFKDAATFSFVDETSRADASAPSVAATKRIWVIEDDFVIGSALVGALEDACYDAVQLYDVAEVAARTDQPAFVVLDVCLRECDAIDVLQSLQGKGVGCPIQILSGSGLKLLEEIRSLGLRRGLDMLPVLCKPASHAEVRTIVDRTLALPAQSGAIIAFPSKAKDPAAGAHSPVDLAIALSSGWVEIWYQPKVSLASGAIVGAECLARVRHPERGVLRPCDFLKGAREADMATLTETVIARACGDWADFQTIGRAVRLAVNIPGSALTQMPLVRLVREQAPKSHGWAGLTLEITEDEALRDIEAAREVSTQLTIYGVELSIDDFGVGYSGLARLREIPFGEIKLDRSFVDGCASDGVHGALCRSVVDLAHSFGARAVAEGIERKDDADFLNDLSCDVGQGYFFARPMPKAELLAMVRGTA